MKGFAITPRGVEDLCAKEISSLIGVKCKVLVGCVEFEVKDYSQLCLLCYKAQSVERVLLLIDSFKINSLDDIKADNVDESYFFGKSKFKADSIVIDNKFSSKNVNSAFGEKIFEKFSKKVDLNNPDVIFFAYIVNDKCYIGVDFAGVDLHKRDYRIFPHRNSLRATIAFSMVLISGLEFVDPFTKSGTLPIEAGLYASGHSINFYNKDKFAFLKFMKFDFDSVDKLFKDDKLKIYGYDNLWLNVNNAKKNAKIAGINKLINFSKVDAEWLETKYKEGEVKAIITHPLELSKNVDVKGVLKTYDELFYQAEYVLSPKGKGVLISRNKEELVKSASKHKFEVIEEREVYSGKQLLHILVLRKVYK